MRTRHELWHCEHDENTCTVCNHQARKLTDQEYLRAIELCRNVIELCRNVIDAHDSHDGSATITGSHLGHLRALLGERHEVHGHQPGRELKDPKPPHGGGAGSQGASQRRTDGDLPTRDEVMQVVGHDDEFAECDTDEATFDAMMDEAATELALCQEYCRTECLSAATGWNRCPRRLITSRPASASH